MMLASRDTTLLIRMAEVASRALGLVPPPALVRCDAVEIRISEDSEAIEIEARPVRDDGRYVTVAVFAGTRGNGGERMAAQGRFTFSRPTEQKD